MKSSVTLSRWRMMVLRVVFVPPTRGGGGGEEVEELAAEGAAEDLAEWSVVQRLL